MDATYRTCRLSIPLFFLVVRTNSGFMTVATFALQNEDTDSIAEALEKIKEHISEHGIDIKNFMVDFSTAEINALHTVFPDATVYLCDFHRKQAWLRWLRTKDNGVADHKASLLHYMDCVADSYTLEQYEKNLQKLRSLSVWKREKKLRDYFEKKWLPYRKVHVHVLCVSNS